MSLVSFSTSCSRAAILSPCSLMLLLLGLAPTGNISLQAYEGHIKIFQVPQMTPLLMFRMPKDRALNDCLRSHGSMTTKKELKRGNSSVAQGAFDAEVNDNPQVIWESENIAGKLLVENSIILPDGQGCFYT